MNIEFGRRKRILRETARQLDAQISEHAKLLGLSGKQLLDLPVPDTEAEATRAKEIFDQAKKSGEQITDSLWVRALRENNVPDEIILAAWDKKVDLRETNTPKEENY